MNSGQLDLATAQDESPRDSIDHTWCVVPESMLGILRDYQHKLIDDTRAALEQSSRVLLQSPTGSGKTHIITAIAAAATKAGLRTLILATRTRIVRQLHERLHMFHVQHGAIAAALPDLRWNGAPVQVASIDTLYRRALLDERMPLPPADLVIFDEAHLALGSSRVAILDRYADAMHLGFTATPAKVSGRPLSDRFDRLIRGPSVKDLIGSGNLVKPRIFAAPVLAAGELAAISKDSKTGDYAAGELGQVMSRPKLTGDVLRNWLRIANGKRTLIFACNKAHGAALVEEFLRAGITAELLTDEDAESDREAAIARLERGDTLVLINCFLLSYGVDIPAVECISLARPTRSVTLYLQAVGRGMRPAPDKSEVIVIDHGRVVESLGLPHEEFEWSLEAGGNVNVAARSARQRKSSAAETPRVCPECQHLWLVSDEGPGCTSCGWAPAPAPKVVKTVDVDLREASETAADQAAGEQFFAEALDFYRNRWPDRWREREKSARWWAWSQTREILKVAAATPPGRFWNLSPRPCAAPTAGKLKSRLIAFARARASA